MDAQITSEKSKKVNLSGQLSKKRTWAPLKVLFTITGISLLTSLTALIARYIFALRATATAELADHQLIILVRYSLFGKEIRTLKTITPTREIQGIQVENRNRYIHLVVGFGFLMVGLLSGVHWLLDGIGAGYPYLALLGAGIILAGVAIDVLLYHFVPTGAGQKNVVLATSGWQFRFTDVPSQEADAFTLTMGQLLTGTKPKAEASPSNVAAPPLAATDADAPAAE